ncbi:50S ribosomal protein L35 [Mucisphaera calidilacus]|uniref:Large ribosomal subunit protein bL35 n=1 Tax=Mucisphaera calidilacus TaxID=2527982 RepID=A0A518BTL0_9BACT|nr:50S ribosomal protein L35 [Mucisphaera calidilacus]QDU70310.1 50S ribosomal protein L35 [Mucisphaera calidilacus]
MPKQKTHKGLLKRVRVTARGKVKFRKVGTSHLNSGLTGQKMRDLRQPAYAKKGDVKKLSRMLMTRIRSTEYIARLDAERENAETDKNGQSN